MTTMSAVWAAYEGSSGQWTGCNWRTHYGSLGLNLDGVSSAQAHQAAGHWRAIAAERLPDDEITAGEESSLVDMALHLRLRRRVVWLGSNRSRHLEVCGQGARQLCAELLAREWKYAADWLAELESDARWAEDEAREAVRAARAGDWELALEHAHRACSIASVYNARHPWRRFEQVIRTARR